MGCDSISDEFRRIRKSRDQAAEILATEGLDELFEYAMDHGSTMNTQIKTKKRYELMKTLEGIEDRQLEALDDDEVFTQASKILSAAGVSEQDERYRSLMTGMIEKLKGVDRSIEESTQRLVGSTALEALEV